MTGLKKAPRWMNPVVHWLFVLGFTYSG